MSIIEFMQQEQEHVAEAGVITNLPVVAVRPLWWEALGWLFIIITTILL